MWSGNSDYSPQAFACRTGEHDTPLLCKAHGRMSRIDWLHTSHSHTIGFTWMCPFCGLHCAWLFGSHRLSNLRASVIPLGLTRLGSTHLLGISFTHLVQAVRLSFTLAIWIISALQLCSHRPFDRTCTRTTHENGPFLHLRKH